MEAVAPSTAVISLLKRAAKANSSASPSRRYTASDKYEASQVLSKLAGFEPTQAPRLPNGGRPPGVPPPSLPGGGGGGAGVHFVGGFLGWCCLELYWL